MGKSKTMPKYCPECGEDLRDCGFMTEETILGTAVIPSDEYSEQAVFRVLESETAIQAVMCGNCGDDISGEFPEGFVITYLERIANV